jgi:hypothetical protein
VRTFVQLLTSSRLKSPVDYIELCLCYRNGAQVAILNELVTIRRLSLDHDTPAEEAIAVKTLISEVISTGVYSDGVASCRLQSSTFVRGIAPGPE